MNYNITIFSQKLSDNREQLHNVLESNTQNKMLNT